MTTYRIIRHYKDMDAHDKEIITEGLTLEEAQAHCKDPETSSSTCTNDIGMRRTQKYGDWMDTYDREK